MKANVSTAVLLIVDDDQRSRLALQELLQAPGYATMTAENGEEALRCVLKQDFAVILLDVRMPGVDGFETARLIRQREHSRHTPIIFLTGAAEDVNDMFRGYEVGAVDYIVKPPIPEILKSKIAVFVELHDKNTALTREISVRRQAEAQLRDSEEKLRALAAHLESVREEERTRISREIHDELGQALTGLKMDLMWIVNRLPPDQPKVRERSQLMMGVLDHTVQSVREIASRLRPTVLDEYGLTDAIGWLAKDFARRTGIRCRVTLPPEPLVLDQDRSTAVFRICQELLTNVARHAEANRVDVAMRVEAPVLVLVVEDNGKGIDPALSQSPKSVGLQGVRERILPFGGSLEITGVRDKGTKVRVAIPLGLK